MPSIRNNGPVTVYIRFTGELPKLFVLTDTDENVEYFRYMDGRTPRIKFNVPIAGEWIGNTDFDIVKICPVEIPDNLPELPPAQRDRHPETIEEIFEPSWNESPASNFTTEGVIVYGPAFYDLIRPIRVFITLHEKGHFFYANEELCDLFAFVSFLRMGYNRSTAYYALSKVLNRSPEGIERIKAMMQNIISTTGEFSPK